MDQAWPTHFLFRATGQSFEAGAHVCCLCGQGSAEPVPVEQVIRDTFTDHGLCRAPLSRDVCPACSSYFNTRWRPDGAKKDREFRLCSLRVQTDSWREWPRAAMRADLEAWLRDGCPESVLVASLAKKKHLLPLASVNPSGKTFTVRVEAETVRLQAGTWFPIAEAFDRLLSLGMTKGNILSGNYYPTALRRAPLAEVLALDARIRPWRPSGLLTLVSYTTITRDADAEPSGAPGDRPDPA